MQHDRAQQLLLVLRGLEGDLHEPRRGHLDRARQLLFDCAPRDARRVRVGDPAGAQRRLHRVQRVRRELREALGRLAAGQRDREQPEAEVLAERGPHVPAGVADRRRLPVDQLDALLRGAGPDHECVAPLHVPVHQRGGRPRRAQAVEELAEALRTLHDPDQLQAGRADVREDARVGPVQREHPRRRGPRRPLGDLADERAGAAVQQAQRPAEGRRRGRREAPAEVVRVEVFGTAHELEHEQSLVGVVAPEARHQAVQPHVLERQPVVHRRLVGHRGLRVGADALLEHVPRAVAGLHAVVAVAAGGVPDRRLLVEDGRGCQQAAVEQVARDALMGQHLI